MPDPSRIAGVIATRRSSVAAMSHSQSPKMSEYVFFGGVAGGCVIVRPIPLELLLLDLEEREVLRLVAAFRDRVQHDADVKVAIREFF